ncbi:cystathionine gamma-synthase [Acuticoccus sediminis]|uniref:Cystathionine gamma-synthase n=1 Tax=Acuticoccus sediminis TaxID=2184697 RepID=A0A8B2NT00_9HYPH|nr:PLP-dependent transferase [Acuticoccus sediminis]RAH99389.1 cystathionine gamma-synthase [Acuticoccus sediminis]
MSYDRATIAAQANGQIDTATGGIVGAWQPSTTFVRDTDYATPPSGDVYRRPHAPTTREAEAVIAALEGGVEAALFSSGLAAAAALMRAAGGPRVAVQRGSYYGTQVLAERLAEGTEPITFDGASLDSLRETVARHKPALVLIETPSNPFLDVIDIASAAKIAHEAGASLAVDSTTATPILTRPIEHGADIVMHSATKGLNGHSDVLAGALVVGGGDRTLFDAALDIRSKEGCVLSPFDAWLLTRGMRTVHLRVTAASHAALHIANWLASHPKVTTVRYPGLPGHPGHAVAAAQMTGGFGALLSFDVAGGAEAALALAARLKLVKRATSLGGVETLIEHRHSIEPPSTHMPPGLLRLSVGIEAVGDIVADLDQALDAVP